MPLSTKTICCLYGDDGLEQFLGKEHADAINDVTATEDGQSFALCNPCPLGQSDISGYIDGTLYPVDDLGDRREITAAEHQSLKLLLALMVYHKIDLIH